MSIHVSLNHVTHYRYDRRVGLSPQLIRLRPAPHCRTSILSYSLRVEPRPHFINWQQDPQGNYVARVAFPDPVEEFRVEVNLIAETAVYNPFDFFLEPHVERFPFSYDDCLLHELRPFVHVEPASPVFSAYLEQVSTDLPDRTIDMLVAINRRVQQDIRYVIRLDPGVQTTERTLELGTGSCRDSTWLLVQLLRHMGLAARFASGYLIQLVPDVRPENGPPGPTEDFTDLHAWCEVYLPGAGWIGLDPTSGLLAGEGHVPLTCTPEPASAAPITGRVDPCEASFTHTMRIERLHESPRITRPYTDTQWAAIDALGRDIDDALDSLDVRLTMGGEPTFVSADDRDGAEWNTEALGPDKRGLAMELLWRLRAHTGTSGFVHVGQGKWYPGEQLPRWALGCYWRRDGHAIWHDPSLFADERRDHGLAAADAELFIQTLAGRLGVDAAYVQPGYEDAWYYLWRERRLPSNVDAFDARLDDPLERDRVQRVFDQGLESIVGYVLPLAHEAGRWISSSWFLRGPRLLLVPGDSPMGYRLPIDSLPWVSEADYPYVTEVDPTVDRPPLSMMRSLDPHAVRIAASAIGRDTGMMQSPEHERIARAPLPNESASWIVRTALCTQTRRRSLRLPAADSGARTLSGSGDGH